MKTILVLGGAGFIGNHLCRKLLEIGNRVVCIDNFASGSFNLIKDLAENENFLFIYGDICEGINYDRRVDEIYHLACVASPKKYILNPMKVINSCLIGTMQVADFAAKTGAHLLYTSTSEVYGEPITDAPMKETDYGTVDITAPRACYSESKRSSETILYAYPKLKFTIARLFNVYGPGISKDDGRVFVNFIEQCKANKPMTVYGDGTQTRSFAYIDDVVDALILLMEKRAVGSINIGNPDERSVNDIASFIGSMFGNDNIVNLAYDGGPTKRVPDIALAKSYGWQPTTDFKSGILKTVEYLGTLE